VRARGSTSAPGRHCMHTHAKERRGDRPASAEAAARSSGGRSRGGRSRGCRSRGGRSIHRYSSKLHPRYTHVAPPHTMAFTHATAPALKPPPLLKRCIALHATSKRGRALRLCLGPGACRSVRVRGVGSGVCATDDEEEGRRVAGLFAGSLAFACGSPGLRRTCTALKLCERIRKQQRDELKPQRL
jgi:hypothetical protein